MKNPSTSDGWAEWKKLLFFHIPAGIRALGEMVKLFITIGVGVIFVRLTLWPVIKYTLSAVVALPSPLDGAKAAVLVSLVIGFVAVFAGICICVCRYWDTR